MLVSFVILTHRRPRLLEECLDSLAAAGADRRAEVVVGLNGGASEDEARRFEESRPWARFVVLPRSPRGTARNRLVPLTRAPLLFFLDDDATVRPDFLDRLEDAAGRHARAPILGGPNLGPADAPIFERTVDFLLRSSLGAGPMRRRYQPGGVARPAPSWSFMLSGLGARRELFTRHGLSFPADCVSAEENLFIHRAERAAGPGMFCPELFVTHRRRPGLRSFLSQVFVNGRGRAQITRMAPGSLQAAVLAPTFLCVYAALLPVLPRPWGWVPGLMYVCVAAAETSRLALAERDPAAALRLPALYPMAHVSYALGFWTGLLGTRR